MAIARQKGSGRQLHSREAPGAAILPEEAFHLAFRRERVLADRGRRRFCVAVFRLPAHGFRSAWDPDVAKALLRHARLTDDVGFLQGTALGVLLRETGPEGAAVFCKRVADNLAKFGTDAAWTVFRYPHTETSYSSALGTGTARNRGADDKAREEHNTE
jgi:hypothetical protein